MALNPSSSSNLEQLALKGLRSERINIIISSLNSAIGTESLWRLEKICERQFSCRRRTEQ